MAFGSLEAEDGDAPVAEINMVPLIDVMLVLLVIFIIAAPLMTHAVKMELPQARAAVNARPPQRVELSIDRAGQVYWNGEAVDAAALDRRLADGAARQPQPDVQLRADRLTTYERVAQTLATVAGHGLTRVGFVTDPGTTATPVPATPVPTPPVGTPAGRMP